MSRSRLCRSLTSWWGLWTLLTLTLLCRFVPWQPRMPTSGLDPSWMLAINEAVARRLVIGTDVVFTFGPYASVYSGLYHPATDVLMMGATVLLALSTAVALRGAIGRASPIRLLALTLAFAGFMALPDAWLMGYPVLAGLALARLLQMTPDVGMSAAMPAAQEAVGAGVPRWAETLAVAGLYAPLGLLGLVKGSLLPISGLTMLLGAVACAFLRRWSLALAVVMAPTATAAAAWAITGQPLTGLPSYVASMMPIIAGYTEAMSLKGRGQQVSAYALAGIAMLVVLVRHRDGPPVLQWIRSLLMAAYLLLGLKAGFVRHDEHAFISAGVLALAVLILPVRLRWWGWVALVAISMWACRSIEAPWVNRGAADLPTRIAGTYQEAWSGLVRRMGEPGWLPREYARALQSIGLQARWPRVTGPTDVYPVGQAQLIAAGLDWAPRPVLQSYSAYTPALSQANEAHLRGPRAPTNIFLHVDPIDERWPSLDDGESWPTLLQRYEPRRLIDDFLLLQRRVDSPVSADPARWTTVQAAMAEAVAVPVVPGLVRARIRAQLTVWGRVVSALYKTVPLDLEVKLADGRTLVRRLPSAMAASPFVLSPMVATTEDFALMFGGPESLASRRVVSLRLVVRPGGERHWQTPIEVDFDTTLRSPGLDVWPLLNRERPVGLPEGTTLTARAHCDGSIDRINDGPIGPGRVLVGRLLGVDGWLTTQSGDQDLPDAAYVVLTDAQGTQRLLATTPVSRRDVADHLKQPQLERSGYRARADLSGLVGPQIVGLALRRADRIEICRNFSQLIEIGN